MAVLPWATLAVTVIHLTIATRWNGQDRASLAAAICFTLQALLFGALAATQIQDTTWGETRSAAQLALAGLWAVLAAGSLAAAQRCWDDWTRRRRRLPARLRGRVGVRLGRLVIIPAGAVPASTPSRSSA